MDTYCRYCSSYKMKQLNEDGLCNICLTRKMCVICCRRRQSRFFKDGKDCCLGCEKNQSFPKISSASVRNMFLEELLPTDEDVLDISMLVRDLEPTIISALDQRLMDEGYYI